MIHVTRKNKALGSYPLEDLNTRLMTGELRLTDLAWYEGLPGWIPISSIPGVAVPAVPPVPSARYYTDYAEVPWFRRSSTNTAFILAGVFSCGLLPGILIACAVLLTGDVYYSKPDAQGFLKRWSLANKIVAALLLVANVFYLGLTFFEIWRTS